MSTSPIPYIGPVAEFSICHRPQCLAASEFKFTVSSSMTVTVQSIRVPDYDSELEFQLQRDL